MVFTDSCIMYQMMIVLPSVDLVDCDYILSCGQVFFSPEIYTSDFSTSLPEVVDQCIQSTPIDTRRALYKVLNLTRYSSCN